jgi:putative endonuclease
VPVRIFKGEYRMPGNQYYVYIMTTRNNTAIYTGITNNLIRRIHEHRNGMVPGFTKRYKINKLVYYEAGKDVIEAITREKQIKSWVRQKKLALISSVNHDWHDLYNEIQ